MRYVVSNFNPSDFKILIVDDMVQNIKFLGSILRDQGYLLSFSLNGEEALKIFETQRFDIVLLDIMMPGMSGFDVCKQIKQKQKYNDIPIIFISASSEIQSIIKGFKLGAVDYITKPFQPDELLARVQTHLELKQTKEQLIETITTKDKIFSIIAHDIKNPLNAIHGTCDLFSEFFDDLTEDEMLSYISQIKSSGNSLIKLLDNLLEWSRIQIGRINVNAEIIYMNAIIDSTFNILLQQAEAKQIQLISTIDDSTQVYGDSNMISTVIRNLVSNAIKYTHHEGKVTIYSKTMNDHEEITISDTGTGIPPDKLDTIFQIKDCSMPGTDGETGTGLGLIICKDFICKNNGSIWVESEVGVGTDFKFTIPRNPSKCLTENINL